MRFLLISLSACAMLLVSDGTTGAEPPPGRYEFVQIEMGVPFKITLYCRDESAANKAARAAWARLKELNAILSDYDPDSELSRLCRTSGPGRPVRVSPELYTVLEQSLKLSKATDGAFDVTIGPCVRLWRIARRRKRLPSAKELAAARKLVGYEKIKLHPDERAVELLQPGMQLDLGGIAKGFAGDEALKVLRQHGVTQALIDGSGDIVAGDPPPGREAWIVEVASTVRRANDRRGGERRAESGESENKSIALANTAVATSGDAYQYLEIDGVRYSHILDPRTGLGLTRRSSVTVIAPTGAQADSLASAVSVLGPAKGLKLIDAGKKTAALVVTAQDGSVERWASRRFGEFVVNRGGR